MDREYTQIEEQAASTITHWRSSAIHSRPITFAIDRQKLRGASRRDCRNWNGIAQVPDAREMEQKR